MKKQKLNTYKPKSVEDAIYCLQQFLESDLWSKFINRIDIEGETFFRKDVFKTEKDLWNYLNGHFDILRKEIRILEKKKK